MNNNNFYRNEWNTTEVLNFYDKYQKISLHLPLRTLMKLTSFYFDDQRKMTLMDVI